MGYTNLFINYQIVVYLPQLLSPLYSSPSNPSRYMNCRKASFSLAIGRSFTHTLTISDRKLRNI